MISNTSKKREIKDLQRLLLAVGLMRPKGAAKWKAGVWGDETQRGVLAAYTQLGWDHPVDARWISAPALAAVAAALHVHGVAGQVTSAGVGGGGHIGGGGNIGGGSNIGGGGNIGGGSHIGGGSNIGGGGNIGGGSHIGGGGNIGGGSHIG
jgi:hypothetical protein